MVYRIPDDIEEFGARQYFQGDSMHLAKYESKGMQASKPTFLTEHTLIFILEGSKTIYHDGNQTNVDENSFILLKRGYYLMCEKLAEDKNYKSIAIYFNENWISHFRDRFFQIFPKKNSSYQKLRVAQTTEIHQNFITSIQNMLLYDGKYFDSLTANKLEELLFLLSDNNINCPLSEFISEIFTSNHQKIDQIVMENLFNPLNLEDLAKLSGSSLSTFKRRFRELFNKAPKKWILEKRIEHAKLLLETTSSTVNEIAYKCGFEDTSYFIKSYKRHFGTTPKGKVTK